MSDVLLGAMLGLAGMAIGSAWTWFVARSILAQRDWGWRDLGQGFTNLYHAQRQAMADLVGSRNEAVDEHLSRFEREATRSAGDLLNELRRAAAVPAGDNGQPDHVPPRPDPSVQRPEDLVDATEVGR